jgi:hypothetical protein
MKITPTIDMDKKISQQIHFATFTNRAPAEVFRIFLSQAMTPYLKSFLRQQKERFEIFFIKFLFFVCFSAEIVKNQLLFLKKN